MWPVYAEWKRWVGVKVMARVRDGVRVRVRDGVRVI